MFNTRFLFPTILTIALFPSSALANKVKKLDVKPIDGKANAGIIKVYSSNGESWNRVDVDYISTFKMGLRAKCKYEGKGNKAYKGKFYVDNFERVSASKPSNHLIPHSSETKGEFRYTPQADFDPIDACERALEKELSKDAGKSKYDVLAKGMDLHLKNAVKGTYSLTCNPTAAGFGDVKSRSTNIDTVVKCQASDLAKEKIKPEPVEIKKAVIVPLIKSVTFKPEKRNYTGKCPMSVKLSGTITANRPGTVKYQYIRNDGETSPTITLKFDKAGSKAVRNWTTLVKKPEPGKTLARATGDNDSSAITGNYTIKAVEPADAFTSVKANYKVYCTERATMKLKVAD